MIASLKQIVKLILEISRLVRLKLKPLPLILKAVLQNWSPSLIFTPIHSCGWPLGGIRMGHRLSII